MKGKSAFNYIIILIVLVVLFVILTDNKSIKANSYEYKNLLENILFQRLVIINDMLFKNNSIENSFSRLRMIEKDKALEWDINYLKEIKGNPTDFVHVKGLKIKDLNLIYKNKELLRFNARIIWALDDKNEEFHHIIEVISEDGRLYLTDLK